ncbi:MAG: hypothetical protein NZ901_12565 [Geminocystis sp.]|nr:hypothetical protein [Geminocystis sp.]HIK36447.1 hypothetical protein [Geminocystis sp. M7585_C2015_104]MCS7149001.1 hypothetical protein [Geminocystis sp.]MCX8077359.1 hypothetical protein [Geminocystis sp.]MDW8114818.1 hypothetical protein [Geminocystis sp.]
MLISTVIFLLATSRQGLTGNNSLSLSPPASINLPPPTNYQKTLTIIFPHHLLTGYATRSVLSFPFIFIFSSASCRVFESVFHCQ